MPEPEEPILPPNNFFADLDFNVFTHPPIPDWANIHVEELVKSSRRYTTAIKQKITEDDKTINLLDKYGYDNFINENKNIINVKHSYYNNNKFTLITFPYSKNKLSNLALKIDIDNYKYELMNHSVNYLINYSITSDEKIKQLAYVKIKSYKESSRLFGYGKIKKEMYEKSLDLVKDNGFGIQKIQKGELFIIDAILPDFTCKKDKSIKDIFQIKYNGKNLKFVSTDLELVYPDIKSIIKGFNDRKDRTVRKNSNVLIKTKDKSKITGVVVERLEPIGYMKFSKVKIGDQVKIFNNKKLKVI